jgi:hypothetical protein
MLEDSDGHFEEKDTCSDERTLVSIGLRNKIPKSAIETFRHNEIKYSMMPESQVRNQRV